MHDLNTLLDLQDDKVDKEVPSSKKPLRDYSEFWYLLNIQDILLEREKEYATLESNNTIAKDWHSDTTDFL